MLIQNSEDFEIKVCNLGFAEYYLGLYQENLLPLNNLVYLPPEVLQGSHEEMDFGTDVYQLGLLAYILMCNRMPFRIKNIREFAKTIGKTLKFPPKVCISSECKDLIEKMLCSSLLHRIQMSEIIHHRWLWASEHELKQSQNRAMFHKFVKNKEFEEELKRQTLDQSPLCFKKISIMDIKNLIVKKNRDYDLLLKKNRFKERFCRNNFYIQHKQRGSLTNRRRKHASKSVVSLHASQGDVLDLSSQTYDNRGKNYSIQEYSFANVNPTGAGVEAQIGTKLFRHKIVASQIENFLSDKRIKAQSVRNSIEAKQQKCVSQRGNNQYDDHSDYPSYFRTKRGSPQKGGKSYLGDSYQETTSSATKLPPSISFKNKVKIKPHSRSVNTKAVSVATSPVASPKKQTVLSKHSPERDQNRRGNKRKQLSMAKPKVALPQISRIRTIKQMGNSGFHKQFNSDLI
ncbi:unnamed protein product [Moneuplotes crassus]|uniref:Protein kinase domain-containing protein n=2 Tax=Euplotes crassus TaxID=5936 RepID=A0AAD1U0Q6_EUPCR|nr:unnamed protein product [Moneuplotes crassus]